MSKINVSIDLNKLTDVKKVKHSNGALYYSFDVVQRKEPDQWGKTHYVVESQTKEERELKHEKNYIGQGKEFIFGGGQQQAQSAQATQAAEEEDNLPF